MRTGKEVGEILDAESDPARRILYFSAFLASDAGAPELIVVGGSAIEIYTRGQYLSGDIDFVGDRTKLVRILEDWGFAKGGRVWHHAVWKLVVDIPSKEYHGDLGRTRTVATPFGGVRLAAVEDLIASRLISARYWEIPKDFDHAVLLAAEYGESIDWEYVTERSRQDRVEDLVPEVRRRGKAARGGKV